MQCASGARASHYVYQSALETQKHTMRMVTAVPEGEPAAVFQTRQFDFSHQTQENVRQQVHVLIDGLYMYSWLVPGVACVQHAQGRMWRQGACPQLRPVLQDWVSRPQTLTWAKKAVVVSVVPFKFCHHAQQAGLPVNSREPA